jgi:hypothetical protein
LAQIAERATMCADGEPRRLAAGMSVCGVRLDALRSGARAAPGTDENLRSGFDLRHVLLSDACGEMLPFMLQLEQVAVERVHRDVQRAADVRRCRLIVT